MLNNFLNKLKGQDNSPKPDRDEPAPDNSLEKWKPGDIILERYRIDDIFSGAMGRVYIAEHLGWKVRMAIKAPRPEVLADQEGFSRILTEANSWVRMGMHPNVATCYYSLNVDKVPYLFIEFVDGGDLSGWIKSGRCKDLRTVLSLAIQFCHGMEFTHSKEIVHRDIKPGNILITKNALLKITDFGIVQDMTNKQKNLALQEGESEATVGFRGTPSYASPEQFRDTHGVDGRSDIFSFGICLWLMLCGRRPFKHNAVAGKPAPTPLDPNTTFPPILSELLVKSVAYNPDERYQTFVELREDLNKAHIAMFRVPCPYMDLDFSDLQAENLNNRAVSLLELGKQAKGERCLQKALDMDDRLTEAIFNYTLLKWKQDGSPKRLLKQLEASQARTPEAKMLATLSQAIKCDLLRDDWTNNLEEYAEPSQPKKKYFPEFLLCLPKNSLEVFQNSQLMNSAKANLTDLLAKKQYVECYKLLKQVWGNNNFKQDSFLTATYEKLVKFSKKKELLGSIRLRTIRNYSNTPIKILCIPGTNKFLTLGDNGIIVVRNYDGKGKVKHLGKYKSVSVTEISPNGTYLGLGFADGRVIIISLKSGKTEGAYQHQEPVSALSFHNTSKHITAGFRDGLIKVYPFADRAGEELDLAAQDGGAITSLLHFKKGNDFISGSSDGKIRHWYMDEQLPLRIINAHAMPLTISSAANSGLLYLSSSLDLLTKIWDRQTGQCMRTIQPHDESITAALMLQDSNYFITAGNDDIIKLWDLTTGKTSLVLDGRSDGISTLAPGPRPHIFCSGGQDGTIIFWMAIYELEFF